VYVVLNDLNNPTMDDKLTESRLESLFPEADVGYEVVIGGGSLRHTPRRVIRAGLSRPAKH